MKKMGIFALALAATTAAYADQDYIKSFSWTSFNSQSYTDQDSDATGNGNEIGWAGFDGSNKVRNRWENTVKGTIALEDEGDLELSVYARLRRDKYYNDTKNYTRANTWKTITELSKTLDLGGFENTWVLGWEYNQSSNNATTSSLKSKGYSNEFYFGPRFNFDVFGQNVEANLQGVYFNSNGDRDADYYIKNSEGLGINANLSASGDIISGDYGSFGYDYYTVAKFKDGFGAGEKSNVYLDLYFGLGYTTPSYKGFYGKASVDTEYERYTANSTGKKENTAAAYLTIGHKSSFDTSIGKITFNPFVSYKPWERVSDWTSGSRVTTETNEWRAGFTLGYTAR